MQKIFTFVFVLVFIVILCLPMAQMQLAIVPPIKLVNADIPSQPKFSWEQYWSGRWQQQFERWFVRANKLWGYLLRTDNQINFSLFSQVGSRYGMEMHVGNDNFLYQLLYIKEINNQFRPSTDKLHKKVEQLKSVQDYLRKRNKAFIVLISQSKLAHNPAIVPSWQRSQHFNSSERSANVIRKLFDQQGIHYLDTGQLFEQNKTKVEFTFFNKAGSHWTQPAACLVARELSHQITLQLGKKLNQFDCGKTVTWLDRPKVNDGDLTKAINIWSEASTYGLTPYIDTIAIEQPGTIQPNVLIVGTSFMWSIRSILERYSFYKNHDFYFYNQTNYYYRTKAGKVERGKRPINRNKHDWDKILSHDVIVLEASEALLPKLGFRFVDSFIEHLKTGESQGISTEMVSFAY